MAMEAGDLNSLQVEMDLARRPPAPAAAQASGPGPEIVEEVAEGAAGAAGGGSVGPPVAATSYPGIQDMSVHLAPPGFTVCESFFDSGVFTCFNPEVVFGTEVRLLPNGSFSMGDDVWCNVTIEDGRIESAELATAADAGATVSVHVADIRPDGVKQYHVGAIVIGGGGGTGVTPDGVSTEFIPPPGEGEDPSGDEGRLQIKRWKSVAWGGDNTPVIGQALLGEFDLTGSYSERYLIVAKDADSGDLIYITTGPLPLRSGCIENGSENQGDTGAGHNLRLYCWENPAQSPSATTLAADLAAGDAQNSDKVLVRGSDGVLKYKGIGKIAGITSVDDALKVVTAVDWLQGTGPSGHEYSIRVTKQKIVISNGALTLDATKTYEYIDTVAHSAVYPNS